MPTSVTVKYLGLYTNRLRIKSQSALWRPYARMLSPHTTKNDYARLKVKLLIYIIFLNGHTAHGFGALQKKKKKMSNTNNIQTSRNLALRPLSHAPPFVSNQTNDTTIFIWKLLTKKLKSSARVFTSNFYPIQNPLIKNRFTLTLPGNPRRRLKTKWCRDVLRRLPT